MASNEYLDAFIELHGEQDYAVPWFERMRGDLESASARMTARREMVKRYAWAVPTPRAIETIAALSPIVEVGAGTGYWAGLLRDAGAEVAAFDIAPHSNEQADARWSAVQVGDARKAMAGGRRAWTLFLCWPPYNSPMAATALRAHRGEHVVYIGEDGGCTADEDFHRMLTDYDQVASVGIPQWDGLHDYCGIYRRR